MLLKILFPAAAALAVLLLRCLFMAAGIGRRSNLCRELGIVLFGVYLLLVCDVTINYVQLLQWRFERGSVYNLIPFEGIADILSQGITGYAILNLAGNIVLFLPFGLFLPLLWRGWPLARVTAVTLLLSSGIEVLQLYTSRGADVDDVLLNTVGSVLGYLLFCLFRVCAPRLCAQFRIRPRETRQSAPAAKSMLPAFSAGVSLLAVGLAAAMLTGNARIPAGRMTIDDSTPARTAQLSAADFEAAPISEAKPALNLRRLHSGNMILLDMETGESLHEKSAGERIYPASMTKIMTAILARGWGWLLRKT
jgi:glycopeptide antibiotics resistance protein